MYMYACIYMLVGIHVCVYVSDSSNNSIGNAVNYGILWRYNRFNNGEVTRFSLRLVSLSLMFSVTRNPYSTKVYLLSQGRNAR